MSFIAVATLAVGVGMGVAKMVKGAKNKREAKKKNEAAKKQMEADKEKYMNMDTSNPYMNMENTMEDLTVNTQAADFAAGQNQAAAADTMASMNQAAGGSGIAALAQAMANQGQIANQKASISIADQEKANQTAERTEASKIQNLEREGEIQSRNLKQKMAATALELSAGDVAGTQSEINAADKEIEQGMDTTGQSLGSGAQLLG